MHGELARRVAAVPGVTTVALANGTPLAGGAWRAFIPWLANRHRPPPSRLMDRSMSSRPNILVSLASAASPGAISRRLTSPRARASPSSIQPGTPQLRRARSRRAAVDVSRRRVRRSGADGDVEIVGVVENTREVGIDEVPFDCIYLPLAQNPVPSVAVLAAVVPGTSGWLDAFRQAVRAVDPDVAGLWRDDDAAARDGRVSIRSLQFPARVLRRVARGVAGRDRRVWRDGLRHDRRIAEFGLRIALGATHGQSFGSRFRDRSR